jgi:hypothetical protein
MNGQEVTAMQQSKAQVPAKQSTTNDPLSELGTYSLLARRPFEVFNAHDSWLDYEIEDWFRAEYELLHPVRQEIAEMDDKSNARVEVPGLVTNVHSIHIGPLRLTISGKHEPQEQTKRGSTVCLVRCVNVTVRVADRSVEADDPK